MTETNGNSASTGSPESTTTAADDGEQQPPETAMANTTESTDSAAASDDAAMDCSTMTLRCMDAVGARFEKCIDEIDSPDQCTRDISSLKCYHQRLIGDDECWEGFKMCEPEAKEQPLACETNCDRMVYECLIPANCDPDTELKCYDDSEMCLFECSQEQMAPF